MKRVLIASLLALTASLVTVVGCEQEDGERCQVDADCKSKVCNVAKNTCASSGSANSPIDVLTPIDAPADAELDAPDAP